MDSMKLILLTQLLSLVMSARLHGMQEENQEGIDDYDMAPEFEDVWTQHGNFVNAQLHVGSRVKNINLLNETYNTRQQVALIRKYWLLEMQETLNAKKKTDDECPQLCMWCEPVKGEFEKTILITREPKNGFKQKLYGPTGQCGRVGFEAFVHGMYEPGESFHTEPQAFSTGKYGLEELRHSTDDKEKWYLQHCEWLRRKPFDVRHVVECMKLYWMCDSNGEAVGIPIPAGNNPQEYCREASKTVPKPPIETETSTAKLFKKAAKEEKRENRLAASKSAQKQKCLALLCKWGGFKKASKQLHPDRYPFIHGLTESEKKSRTRFFKILVNCKDEFTGSDGKELTLNSADDRDEICTDQLRQKAALLYMEDDDS